MRQCVLALIVGLLTFSATGFPTLVAGEPCVGYEQPGSEDAACPPTCATCGCCAQAAEPAVALVTSSLEALVADVSPLLAHVSTTSPRGVLHVPKPLGA